MKNFGEIKEYISKQLTKSLLNENKEGKNLFEEFLKIINKSPILKTQYSIYGNLENKFINSEIKATRYIQENLNLLNKFSYKELINENKKLSKFKIEEDTKGCPCTKKLYEDLDNLIRETVKPTPNIDRKHDSFEGVIEYLMTEDESKKDEGKYKLDNKTYFSSKKIIEMAIKNFNKEYSYFNNQEKEIFTVLFNNDEEGKQRVFESIKNNNINLVKRKIMESDDESLKEKLGLVESKLVDMEYSDDSYVSDILKLDKLSSGF